MKPTSVQLYTIRELTAKDMKTALEKVASLGYKGVEFAGFGNLSASEVSKIIKDLNLEPVAAHIPLPTEENYEQIISDAKTVGYKRLIVPALNAEKMRDLDGLKWCIESLQKAIDLLKPENLSLGIHNHWWEFETRLDGKYPFEIMLEGVPDLFGELDIYWATSAGIDIKEFILKWAERLPLLHVKDGNLQKPHIHKPLGKGKVDIKGILEAASSDKIEWWVVELDNSDMDMIDAIKESIEWLKTNKFTS